MRIGYLINQYPMPSQTFIGREIRALEDLGMTVDRFALRQWNGTLVDERDRNEQAVTRYVTGIGIGRILLALLLMPFRKPFAFLRAARLSLRVARRSDKSLALHLIYLAEACVLSRWLIENKIEHLHVHFATNSTEVAMLSRVLGGPAYSFMVHGPEEFDRAATLSLDEKTARAAFVATISSYARSQLYRWIRFEDWSKINIVRCGLDADYLTTEPAPPQANRRLVCVGRLCEQKGQVLLVEAAAKALQASGPFELVLIGDGDLRLAVEEAIARNQLEEVVQLAGWADRDEVKQHILDSAGLVLASFAEGLPVVIMEALAMGRPVITTWIAGIPELVVDGEMGWLIPAGDVDALAAAISELLATPAEELSRLGVNGRARVLQNHDVRQEAARLHQLITSGNDDSRPVRYDTKLPPDKKRELQQAQS